MHLNLENSLDRLNQQYSRVVKVFFILRLISNNSQVKEFFGFLLNGQSSYSISIFFILRLDSQSFQDKKMVLNNKFRNKKKFFLCCFCFVLYCCLGLRLEMSPGNFNVSPLFTLCINQFLLWNIFSFLSRYQQINIFTYQLIFFVFWTVWALNSLESSISFVFSCFGGGFFVFF